MAEEQFDDQAATSTDIERFFALGSVLAGVDEILESPSYMKNDFVHRILELLSLEPVPNRRKEKIGIDFSSPNIAKPFHVGHLRSTFIGRAIANLAVSAGSEAVRINYLGDWGTQFGLLATAYEKFSGDQTGVGNQPISNGPSAVNISRMRHYFDIYVKANEQADANPEFRKMASDYFERMENARDATALTFWRRVVDESVDDLKTLYSRLNVEFDAWQSEYAAALPAKALLEELERRKFLERTDENLLGIRINDGGDKTRIVPLTKSDGTTLYLTRDVYTALHRSDNLSCTKLIYVVDRSQGLHFRELKEVLNKIGRQDVAEKIVHVKFGRVLGMSTRKGNAVFVDNVLEEGIKRADEVLEKDINTRTPAGSPERRHLGEQLTLSCLIINDLRNWLIRDYEFDWQRVLETKLDGGVSLQKSFSRMSSICERCGSSTVDLDTFRRSMNDREALELIGHVSRYLAPSLCEALDTLEFRPFARHMFKLRKLCGAAARRLRVTEAPSLALRSSRFVLFDTARKVLGLGLRVLGARPLAKI